MSGKHVSGRWNELLEMGKGERQEKSRAGILLLSIMTEYKILRGTGTIKNKEQRT